MATDDETRVMSQLLEKGATMLSEHCDECHNPMFRFRGEKVCAVCETKKAQEKKQRVEDEVEAGADRTAETTDSETESRVLDDRATETEGDELRSSGSSERGREGVSVEAGSGTSANTNTNTREELVRLARRLASEANDEEDLERLERKLDALDKTLDLIERL